MQVYRSVSRARTDAELLGLDVRVRRTNSELAIEQANLKIAETEITRAQNHVALLKARIAMLRASEDVAKQAKGQDIIEVMECTLAVSEQALTVTVDATKQVIETRKLTAQEAVTWEALSK